MFIVDLRNTNVSEYRFSVINNSNVDEVYFYSNFTQYANYSIYLKVRSVGRTYIDKIAVASENVSIEGGALLIKWRMGAVSTQCKRIEVQLQFEQGEDIVAQSRIATIVLSDTIDVSKEIKPIYPDILKELQRQIDELYAESGASCELGYANDTLTLTLKNSEGETLGTYTATIPTLDSFVNVSFANKIITFTDNAGLTKTVDLTGFYDKNEIDTLLAGKVNKTNDANKVYGTDTNGAQIVIPVENYGEGAIPRRDSAGQLQVPLTPTDNGNATSKGYVDGLATTLQGYIDTINSFIPSGATALNKLTTNSEVNDKINSVTAYYITKNPQGDAFATYAELQSATVFYSGGEVRVPTRNDYCIVRDDENHSHETTRYSYQNSQWEYQYTINEAPMSQAQVDAINSGITSALVTQIGTNKSNIESIQGNYVTTNTDQTISATKTFSVSPILNNNVSLTGKDTNGNGASIIKISQANNVYINASDLGDTCAGGGCLYPNAGGTKSLGKTGFMWKDLLLSRYLIGEVYQFTIDNAYKLLYGKYDNNSTTQIDYAYISNISVNANTTFTLKVAPTGCYPEYKALLTNTANTAITITLPSGCKILTNNDEDIVINANTFSMSAGITCEINIMNNTAIVVVF